MTGRYKEYPEYKDSGVEWVGDIPKDWSMWKLAHAFNEIGSGTTPPTSNEEWFKGDIPWITTGELREKVIVDTKKKLTKDTLKAFPTLRQYPVGSVAIAMYGATIGRLGIFGVEATTNQACCVMTHSKQINNKYLFYWLWAFKKDIILLSSGGGQPNINQEKVASLRISAPVIEEQQKIANFLDHETAKIDTLITKQEKLIELLKEKRQAVISHVVTKGLNPDAPMKDSGVEWLGEVPEHWDVMELKFSAKKGYKTFTDGDWIESPYITDTGVRLLQTGNVGTGFFKEQGFRYISDSSYHKLNCTEVKPNDVLICRLDGPVGRSCLAPDLGVKVITSVDNAILKPSDNFDPRFIVYATNSESWINWIQDLCRVGGGFRLRISRTMLGEQKIPCPPLNDQKNIADMLDNLSDLVNESILKSNKSIALLKERKTALISATVTGKIDVRDWQEPTEQQG